jgi:hypothetical protein
MPNQARPTRFGGPRLVGLLSLGLLLMSAAIFGVNGTGEDGMRALVRATARTSAVLLLLAYVASSLRASIDAAATRWLLYNRRYVGVSLAVSHTIHMAAIAGLTVATGLDPNPTTAVLGGLGYLLLLAMAATSTHRAVAWLGPVWWNRLHRTGIHYVWVIFVVTFLGVALGSPDAGQRALAWLATVLLVAALVFRLVVRVREKRRRTRAVSQPAKSLV